MGVPFMVKPKKRRAFDEEDEIDSDEEEEFEGDEW